MFITSYLLHVSVFVIPSSGRPLLYLLKSYTFFFKKKDSVSVTECTHAPAKSVRVSQPVTYPEIFSGGGSTNSVEDRGQRKRGSGGRQPPSKGFHSIFK
jgi:hypothetical protein